MQELSKALRTWQEAMIAMTWPYTACCYLALTGDEHMKQHQMLDSLVASPVKQLGLLPLSTDEALYNTGGVMMLQHHGSYKTGKKVDLGKWHHH